MPPLQVSFYNVGELVRYPNPNPIALTLTLTQVSFFNVGALVSNVAYALKIPQVGT